MFKKIMLTLMIVLMAVSVSAARELDGVTMPETLPVGNDVLGLNGIGLRTLIVIKVYVAGLYLKSASKDPAAIINADEPMVMRLQMLRDVKPKTMNQGLYNGMRNSAGAGFSQIADRTDKFKAMIYDPLVEGDVFNFIYMPGKGLEVYKGSQYRGTIPGLDFKKAFFGIWLNATKPADEGLKASLISGKFTTELAGVIEKKKQEEEAKAAEIKAKAVAEVKAEAQTKEEAEKTAAAAKTTEEAKMAAVAAKAKTEKAKMAKEAKAVKKTAAVASAEGAVASGAEKAAGQMKVAEKAAVSTKAKVASEAKETAAAANKTEAYATADQFAAKDVYFNVNSVALNSAAKLNLSRKMNYLKSNPTAKVVVEPVCDTTGNKEKNMQLANKRGDAVRQFIVNAGIDASRIEMAPVKELAASRVNNRRVHLSIK